MTDTDTGLDGLTSQEKRRLLALLLSRDEPQARRFPVSFAQQRLWFLNQLSPGSPFYNVEAPVPVSGAINADALHRAINEIVRRHEALRTIFEVVDGQPTQVVLPSVTIELPVEDLRGLAATEREQEALRLRTEESQRPFDLATGPLVRTRLVRLGDQEYLFLLAMHHIVSDGWSMGIFGRELETLYIAFATGQEPKLPKLPIQYGDFAVWQRKWLSGDNLEQQLGYWRKQLDGLSTLELPTDRPRPPVQTYRGGFHNFAIGKALTEGLRELSRREGTTLFMTLLTAFKVLLHRYSDQVDIVVGTYIANRNRVEIEGLIGFFLNTLVLRTDVSGDPSFRELLARVKDVSVGAYAHQDLPFEKLVEELHPARDLSRNPLFQVTFQLPNVPTQKPLEGDKTPMDSKRGTSIFDLACMVFETTKGLSGQIEYSCDLFDEATIRRMAAHFEIVLQEAVRDQDRRVSEIPLMTQTERQTVLFEWNATEMARRSNLSLIERFEEQVREHSGAVAFSCGSQSLTYQELDERANRIAHFLLSMNVKAPAITGLLLERSLDFPPLLLGVLKAGLIYLPLDPSYPAERLGYMLRDSQAQLLLTAGRLPECFVTPTGVTVVNLLEHAEEITGQSCESPGVRRSESDLAYVIYTSGSTGVPKGVAASYRQILSRFEWMWAAYPFRQDEVCCQKTALSFVDSVWELLGPLMSGCPTVIVPDRVLKDPNLLVAALAEQRVTRLWLVPSLLNVLLDSFPDLQAQLPRLDFWVTSGEALPASLLERFRHAMPGATLFNLYGTSEAWDATWYDTSQQSGPLHGVPIGKPIANVKVYVLDRHRQPVPIGVPGELYVAGDGLSEGYLNHPEWTSEGFVRLGFLENDVVAYRTGDRARFLADGNIEYLGRLDDQVQLRGFRVEPAEVEAALSQHPRLSRAVVIVHQDGEETTRLAAYIVPQVKPAPSGAEMRRFLQVRLPEFMIPASFIELEDLPMTPSGKLDRRALQARSCEQNTREAGYVAPRDQMEDQMAGIWAQILHLDKVGIQDNFFDLGGHSLLATQVMSRIQKAFGVQLPLQLFFETPTVAELADWVAKAKCRPDQPQPSPITRLAREEYRVHSGTSSDGAGSLELGGPASERRKQT